LIPEKKKEKKEKKRKGLDGFSHSGYIEKIK
jgi:hypothetical protein